MSGADLEHEPVRTSPEQPVAPRHEVRLSDALREFSRWPSPRVLTAVVVTTLALRIALGGWGLADLLLPLGMLAAWPAAEWATHIRLLHMQPKRIAGWTLDPLFARKHREHHADPTDTALVFLPMVVVWSLLGVLALAVPTLFPSVERGLTFLLTLGVIAVVYEWIHYLVHTTYRPRTRPYRALWRHHRLHHYKNENYWFGLTTTAADHAFGTAPEAGAVERSPTARDLLGTGSESR